MRDLEAPSGLGVGTARAMARAYGVFAHGGAVLGLRPATIAALMAPARPARRGFFDECLQGDAQFSLGFLKPSETFKFGHPAAFGAPGAGGAFGYADPEAGTGYRYVTNRMGVYLQGDPARRRASRRDSLSNAEIPPRTSSSATSAAVVYSMPSAPRCAS